MYTINFSKLIVTLACIEHSSLNTCKWKRLRSQYGVVKTRALEVKRVALRSYTSKSAEVTTLDVGEMSRPSKSKMYDYNYNYL